MIVLALSCLIIPFLIVWLIFPVILLLQLRKLTRVLEASSAAQLFSYEQSTQTEPQPEPEPEAQPETEENDPTGSKLI
ncbi:MAG TPA: hypothetical protein VN673_17925 [Clostridia bacterium]|nr:hypothetical protein [Clostridia bacterium]